MRQARNIHFVGGSFLRRSSAADGALARGGEIGGAEVLAAVRVAFGRTDTLSRRSAAGCTLDSAALVCYGATVGLAPLGAGGRGPLHSHLTRGESS